MKVNKMNTKVESVLGECESIISCVENVIDLCDSNDFVTNLLENEEFETIRYTAEDLESIVLGLEDYEYDFTTEESAAEKSIQLYQEIKYICEALEESITNQEILNEFSYMRASVYLIRTLFKH